MESLISRYRNLLAETDTSFVRYLHDEIPWDDRMVAIMGSRGVGKTTLLLQHIKLHLPQDKVLYVSADDLYFSEHRLYDLAMEFSKLGGEYLYIDEVHKYQRWSQELKNIYDAFPRLKVVFTGSSILDIYHGIADLSRRVLTYTLYGMSFREYLSMRKHINLPVFTLEQVLEGKVETNGLDYPLAEFRNYLRDGYYPFTGSQAYEQRLLQIINRILETDIPFYANLNISTIVKLKRLLSIIAQSVPFKPNVSKIAELIGADRAMVNDYLEYMVRAKLINVIHTPTQGVQALGKVDKVYLDNTNLAYALQPQPEIGNIRETFFLNQVSVSHSLTSDDKADFIVDKQYTFEVGGKSKGQRQLAGRENGYIVKDDIEYAYLNTIPLWHFGLLY